MASSRKHQWKILLNILRDFLVANQYGEILHNPQGLRLIFCCYTYEGNVVYNRPFINKIIE